MAKDVDKFDFNIIYNRALSPLSITKDESDSLKFTEYLVKTLDGWGYKNGYYAGRDAVPGRNVFTELQRVVRLSAKTIVVITSGFKRNCWSKYSQQTTFKSLLDKDHAKKFIPIALDVLPQDLPEEINIQEALFFSGDSYFKPEDKNARAEWDRLQKAFKEDKLISQIPHVQEHGDNRLRSEMDHLVTRPVSDHQSSKETCVNSDKFGYRYLTGQEEVDGPNSSTQSPSSTRSGALQSASGSQVYRQTDLSADYARVIERATVTASVRSEQQSQNSLTLEQAPMMSLPSANFVKPPTRNPGPATDRGNQNGGYRLGSANGQTSQPASAKASFTAWNMADDDIQSPSSLTSDQDLTMDAGSLQYDYDRPSTASKRRDLDIEAIRSRYDNENTGIESRRHNSEIEAIRSRYDNETSKNSNRDKDLGNDVISSRDDSKSTNSGNRSLSDTGNNQLPARQPPIGRETESRPNNLSRRDVGHSRGQYSEIVEDVIMPTSSSSQSSAPERAGTIRHATLGATAQPGYSSASTAGLSEDYTSRSTENNYDRKLSDVKTANKAASTSPAVPSSYLNMTDKSTDRYTVGKSKDSHAADPLLNKIEDTAVKSMYTSSDPSVERNTPTLTGADGDKYQGQSRSSGRPESSAEASPLSEEPLSLGSLNHLSLNSLSNDDDDVGSTFLPSSGYMSSNSGTPIHEEIVERLVEGVSVSSEQASRRSASAAHRPDQMTPRDTANCAAESVTAASPSRRVGDVPGINRLVRYRSLPGELNSITRGDGAQLGYGPRLFSAVLRMVSLRTEVAYDGQEF